MNKLEQAARQLVTNWDSGLTIHDELDSLREALAEQVKQEDKDLVAQMNIDVGLKQKVYEALAEQAEQGPVATIRIDRYGEAHIDAYVDLSTGEHDVYTAPVRTKDLSDDEIWEIWFKDITLDWDERCRAVIAADREKNK